MLSDTSVRISWDPSTDNVDEYVVEVRGQAELLTKSVPVNESSVVVSGLKDNTRYNVTVFSVKDGIRSTPSPVVEFTTPEIGEYCNLSKLWHELKL